jgi:hypothetical protein
VNEVGNFTPPLLGKIRAPLTIPSANPLARAEFATIRLNLLKIAARVIETTSRVRLAFAAACPHAALFRGLAAALQPTGP